MKTSTFSVSVLLHRDGDVWVAQCLEYDLAAQAPDEEEVKKRFLRTFAAQILFDIKDKRKPLSALGKAPKRYLSDTVMTRQEGPELPIFVRVPVPIGKARGSRKGVRPKADAPAVNGMARFLKAV
jgi:hypothetical protein